MVKSVAPGILRQTALTFLGQSSGYVVAILTGVVIARTLGPSGKGVVALAMLLLAIFTTYGDGIQSAILYQCGRRHDSEQLVYAASLRLLGAIFLPLAIVLFAVGLAAPRFAALCFVACAIPFAVYGQVANSFFLLRNRIATTVVLAAFNTFGYAAVLVPALLIWHADARAVLAIWAAMYMLGGAYAFAMISRAVPPLRGGGTTRAIVVEQVRFTAKAGSLAVAGFLNLRVDVFVVGLMLDTRTLGIYSLAVATAELLWQLSRPLGWSTLGRIATAERSVAITLTAAVSRNVLAVETVAGAVLFAIAPVAITFVYGSGYTESGYIMRWLIPGVVLYAASGTLGYYMVVKEGKPLTIFFMQAGSVVACAAITATTLHTIGIYGAALATTVTYALSAICKTVAFLSATGSSLASITVLRAEDADRYRRIVDGAYSVVKRTIVALKKSETPAA